MSDNGLDAKRDEELEKSGATMNGGRGFEGWGERKWPGAQAAFKKWIGCLSTGVDWDCAAKLPLHGSK